MNGGTKVGKVQGLTMEQKKEIVELAIETYEKEVERHRKAIADRKIHNTRLLLVNYRGLVANCEGAIYKASQCEQDVYDILQELMSGKQTEAAVHVDSIKKSAAKTRLMIEHINKALSDYESYCYRSKKDEEIRRCKVVKALYIDEDGKTAIELAEQERVDISTIYKDVKEAIKRLTPRIFGIDGLF